MTTIKKLDCPHVSVRMLASTPVEETFRITACSKEPWTCAWIKSMPEGSVLYDIGANVGSYTLMAAALGHQVVAIEPSFANYARLCENILLNDLGDKVIPLCVGLGADTGVELMQQEPSPGYSGGGKRLRVPVVTLDDMHNSLGFYRWYPTHIKLDTDGAEAAVLDGAIEYEEGISWLVEVQSGQEERIAELLGEPKQVWDHRGKHAIKGMSMRLYER